MLEYGCKGILIATGLCGFFSVGNNFLHLDLMAAVALRLQSTQQIVGYPSAPLLPFRTSVVIQQTKHGKAAKSSKYKRQ